LPELDEGRSQLLAREAEANRSTRLRMTVAAERREHSPAGRKIRSQMERIDDVDEAVLDEDTDNLSVSADVRDARESASAEDPSWRLCL
jgi:hypothetical protein